MGTYGQPGYVFRDFCLKQGIDFIIFCLHKGTHCINFCLKQGIFSWTINSLPVLRTKLQGFRVKCLKQGIKNWNSVLNRVGKSAIFVLNRVRVLGAGPHLPSQGYIEYLPPGPPTHILFSVKSKFKGIVGNPSIIYS